MTDVEQYTMSSKYATRQGYMGLTWGVMAPFGWDIMGCFERSPATSCQAFAPNSWIA